jgi:hypothetical protein
MLRPNGLLFGPGRRGHEEELAVGEYAIHIEQQQFDPLSAFFRH